VSPGATVSLYGEASTPVPLTVNVSLRFAARQTRYESMAEPPSPGSHETSICVDEIACAVTLIGMAGSSTAAPVMLTLVAGEIACAFAVVVQRNVTLVVPGVPEPDHVTSWWRLPVSVTPEGSEPLATA
jgi:hypothetical protein